MTFIEARLSLQLMAEERVGAALRADARLERQQEDAAASAAAARASRQEAG